MDNPDLSPSEDQPAEQPNEVAMLRAEVHELREEIKEREVFVTRALKTLLLDLKAYFAKERDDFPTGAVYGAIFAALRPKMVLVIGGIFGAVFTGAQLWFLWQQQETLETQNELVASQNELVASQNKATEWQAVSFMMSLLDPESPDLNEIAIAQLAEFGTVGRDALIRLSRSDSDVGMVARRAVIEGEHITYESPVLLRSELFYNWTFQDIRSIQEGRPLNDEAIELIDALGLLSPDTGYTDENRRTLLDSLNARGDEQYVLQYKRNLGDAMDRFLSLFILSQLQEDPALFYSPLDGYFRAGLPCIFGTRQVDDDTLRISLPTTTARNGQEETFWRELHAPYSQVVRSPVTGIRRILETHSTRSAIESTSDSLYVVWATLQASRKKGCLPERD